LPAGDDAHHTGLAWVVARLSFVTSLGRWAYLSGVLPVRVAYGHYGDALQEACKYVPGLEPVRLDGGG
jgi:hypothetical protein